ncbi:hypothetical protein [Bacillus sp. FJAT-22090]|nr:hypothetical protein [Bacillus sp. FJAT-22090]
MKRKMVVIFHLELLKSLLENYSVKHEGLSAFTEKRKPVFKGY